MTTDATEAENHRLTVECLCADGSAILKAPSLSKIVADIARTGAGNKDTSSDMCCQDAMVHDLPSEVLERFDLILDSVLDGCLGHVSAEQLDDVCEALVALGYSFDD